MYFLRSLLLLPLIILLISAQPYFSTPMNGPQMIMTSSGMVPLGSSGYSGSSNQQLPPYGSLGSSYGSIQNGANFLSPYSRPGFQGQNGQQSLSGQFGSINGQNVLPGQFGGSFGQNGQHGLPGQFGSSFGQQMGGFGGNYQLPGGMYGQFQPFGQGIQGQGYGHGFQAGLRPYIRSKRRKKSIYRKMSRAEASPHFIDNSEEYAPEFSISLPLVSFSVPEPQEKSEGNDDEGESKELEEHQSRQVKAHKQANFPTSLSSARTPKTRGCVIAKNLEEETYFIALQLRC